MPAGEESECPINDISFETRSFFDSAASTGGSYWSDSLSYANGQSLRFSKKGSGLPVHKGVIQPSTPCMIPDQVPVGVGHAYYETEVAKVEGCSQSRLTGFSSDNRYKSLGMDTSVYDVQFHSGVMDTIAR